MHERLHAWFLLYSLGRTALPHCRPQPRKPASRARALGLANSADSSGPRQCSASGNAQPPTLPEPASAHPSQCEATSPPWHLPVFSQGPSLQDRHTAASAKGVVSSEIRLPAPRPATSGFTSSALLPSSSCRIWGWAGLRGSESSAMN